MRKSYIFHLIHEEEEWLLQILTLLSVMNDDQVICGFYDIKMEKVLFTVLSYISILKNSKAGINSVIV